MNGHIRTRKEDHRVNETTTAFKSSNEQQTRALFQRQQHGNEIQALKARHIEEIQSLTDGYGKEVEELGWEKAQAVELRREKEVEIEVLKADVVLLENCVSVFGTTNADQKELIKTLKRDKKLLEN